MSEPTCVMESPNKITLGQTTGLNLDIMKQNFCSGSRPEVGKIKRASCLSVGLINSGELYLRFIRYKAF